MSKHRRPQANFKVSLDRVSGKYQVVAPDGRILAVCDSLDAAVTRRPLTFRSRPAPIHHPLQGEVVSRPST